MLNTEVKIYNYFFLSFLDDFGSEKKIQQTQYCNEFFQLIKSVCYINQTLCLIILPPFEKPFLGAGESEHKPKTQHWRLVEGAISFIIFN